MMVLRRLIYVSIVFISLVFALVTGGRLPYMILSMEILLIALSYFSVIKNEKSLVSFSWSNTKVAHVGDTLEVGCTINNTGIFPVAFMEVDFMIANSLGNKMIPKKMVFMNSFEIINITHDIHCKHRGFYDIGKLVIKIRDIFHIFEKMIIFDNHLELEVYPRVMELDRIRIPATEFFGSVRVQQRAFEDYTSLEGIREYQHGDQFKKIHWKVSAKAGKYFVKNYELSANTRIHMFLDGYRNNYLLDENRDIEERLVEISASIIRYCLVTNLSVSFISRWGERSFIEGRDINKLQVFLKELMHFTPQGNLLMEDVLSTERRMLSVGSTLIIIVVYLSDRLFEQILNLNRNGYNPMLIVVNTLRDEEDSRMLTRTRILKEAGVQFYKVKLRDDISFMLGEIS